MIGALVSYAQSEQKSKNFNVKKGIAINGYDPVSYFDDAPVEGKKELKSEYQGVTYLFSSKKNLNLFQKNPAKYEPAYGGWCAFAMGKTGDKVKIDPKTYKITNGKLYLFYNFRGYNTLIDWNKNEDPLIEKADQYWSSHLK